MNKVLEAKCQEGFVLFHVDESFLPLKSELPWNPPCLLALRGSMTC